MLGLFEDREGVFDALEVVGIADPQDVPVVAHEARCNILGEGDARVPLDGDVVVVVNPTEVVELEMTGQRRGLRADALHEAAVAADCVDVVVEDLEAGPIVSIGQPLSGDRHANARGDALAERSGGRLHPRDPMIFRMSGRLAAELPKMPNVVQGHRRPSDALVVSIHGLRFAQIQHGPEKHRGVAVRQHETVTVGPDRILGIEA